MGMRPGFSNTSAMLWPGSVSIAEVEIRATDVSVAIVSAARLTFPPKTVAVRILDHESQVVFERHKADRR